MSRVWKEKGYNGEEISLSRTLKKKRALFVKISQQWRGWVGLNNVYIVPFLKGGGGSSIKVKTMSHLAKAGPYRITQEHQ